MVKEQFVKDVLNYSVYYGEDAPILEIIQDGVQDYFNDTKSTEFGISRKWHAIEAGLIL